MRTAYKITDKIAELVCTSAERHFGFVALAIWSAAILLMLATL